jgi:hypothetical protein
MGGLIFTPIPVGARAESVIIKRRSMSLEEAILDRVRRLPPAKQEEVLRFAEGLQRAQRTRMVPCSDRTKEMKWLAANRSAYADQWVAVEGDRLIAADRDPLKVFAAAKAEGILVPFVVHVLPEDALPFVPGW